MKLFHYTQKEFPKHFRELPEVQFTPIYGIHAVLASEKDRYGKITLPSKIVFRGENIIEVEVDGKKLHKVVLRFPYDRKHDICYAVIVDSGFVKTVWLNDKNDNHKTLNISNYHSESKR